MGSGERVLAAIAATLSTPRPPMRPLTTRPQYVAYLCISLLCADSVWVWCRHRRVLCAIIWCARGTAPAPLVCASACAMMATVCPCECILLICAVSADQRMMLCRWVRLLAHGVSHGEAVGRSGGRGSRERGGLRWCRHLQHPKRILLVSPSPTLYMIIDGVLCRYSDCGIFSGKACEFFGCPRDSTGRQCGGNGTCLTLRELAGHSWNDRKTLRNVVYDEPWDAE